MTDQYAHICSTRVECPVKNIEEFLTSPQKLNQWAVGMGATVVREDGLIEGHSEATGKSIFARIDLDPVHHTIYYHLGDAPECLVPRIVIQIKSGDIIESGDGTNVISMTAWRQDTMTDERWKRLKTLHENEIKEVKRLIIESQGY